MESSEDRLSGLNSGRRQQAVCLLTADAATPILPPPCAWTRNSWRVEAKQELAHPDTEFSPLKHNATSHISLSFFLLLHRRQSPSRRRNSPPPIRLRPIPSTHSSVPFSCFSLARLTHLSPPGMAVHQDSTPAVPPWPLRAPHHG